MALRHAPTMRPEFTALLEQAGFTHQRQFAKKAKVGIPVVTKFGRGTLPSNHPLLPRLAAALQTTVDRLLPLCGPDLMSEKQIKRLASVAETKSAKKRPGTKLVHVPKVATAVVPVARGPYNSLRKLDKPTRQLVRGLTELVNLQAMKGDRFVALPTLKTDELSAFLRRYYELEGVKGTMLLSGDFADHFDRK